MPSSYSGNLLLELMPDGENDGLWGDITNENLEILGRAISGVTTVALAGTTHTLTVTQGTLSEGHFMVLELGGSPTGTNTITIDPNTVERLYLVKNGSGQDAVFTQGSGGNVTVPNGANAIIYCDGAGSGAKVTDFTSNLLRSSNNLSDLADAATALTNLGITATAAEINLLDGATALGPTTPGTVTDGGVVLFDGADGSALKDGGTQDAIINGLTVGQGGSTSRNVAVGINVLPSYSGPATSGYNVALGYQAGESLTSGERNILIGRNAGQSLTTGDNNTLIGDYAGYQLSASATSITALGALALFDATGSVTATTAVGNLSLQNVTTGDFNDAFGFASGNDVTTGSFNVFFGTQAGTSSSPFQVTTQNNRLVMGNNTVTNAYIKVSWTVTSDERDKTDFATMSHGLDVVDAIDTFTFKFDNRSNYYVYDDDGNIIETPTPDGTHKSERTFVGFKAQQVQAVLDAAGFPSDVVVDTEDPDNLKMKETALIPLLINAVKELKAANEALSARVDALESV